jgi:V/A-type H+-transporting ATPase subunit K
MEIALMHSLAQAGGAMVLGVAAVGSAFGTGAAALAAVGVWKRCYAQERPVPFILVTFIGAPLSQTIYGMILMNTILRVANEGLASGDFIGWPAMMAAGLFGGLGMAASAYAQGRAGAAAADALGETGQGLGNYLMAIGIVETVALFVLVFVQASI